MDLTGRTIVVTGANGFLGARFTEVLSLVHGAQVKAVVRNPSRAHRVARLPVVICPADIRDPEAMRAILSGADAVIHCASNPGDADTWERSSTFAGTKSIVDALQSIATIPLVHLSSCSVYGYPEQQVITEQCAKQPRYKNDGYALAKIEAENYIARELSATRWVVLQPTLIYGPYSSEWTESPLEMLSKADLVMPDSSAGTCNLVSVDDVVAAALQALTHERGFGQHFLINGPEALTWFEFFEKHAAMIAGARVRRVSSREFRNIRRAESNKNALRTIIAEVLREQPLIRQRVFQNSLVQAIWYASGKVLSKNQQRKLVNVLLRRSNTKDSSREAISAKPVPCTRKEQSLPEPFLSLLDKPHHYSADKAKELLGFTPTVSLEKAFTDTSEWARWARRI